MIIGTIHTIYNGRGGIDFFFERVIREMMVLFPDIKLKVFCNKEALGGLPESPQLEAICIKSLDSQYTKPVWLEYFSHALINRRFVDLFWIPSGTNSFPGDWDMPVVTTIHDIGEYHLKNKYGFSRTFYRKTICIPRSLKRSAYLVTPSHFTSSDIKAILGYRKEIAVVYEAADPWLDNEADSYDKETIKNQTGLGSEQFILCVGRLNYFAKGIDTILKGYHALIKKKKKLLQLVFAGPKGEGWQCLESAIKKYALQGHVFYLGEVSSSCLQALYAQSALVINASRFEGFGIPLLEAMKRGKPVLCSDLNIFQEIAQDAPIFFRCGDSVDFNAKLRLFLDGEIDLKKHTDRGKEIAGRYSWQKTAKSYADIFNSVLSG